MNIYFEEEGKTRLNIPYKAIAEKVILATLDYLECPYEAEVNILLTGDEEIHEMNRHFRNIDRPTDVLSFPMVDFVKTGDYSFLEEEDEYFNPETGELVLGDIVISKEKVISQAEEYGHTVEREYAFLITHSMLHLFGYDHIEEDDRYEMEEKQRDILESVKILR